MVAVEERVKDHVERARAAPAETSIERVDHALWRSNDQLRVFALATATGAGILFLGMPWWFLLYSLVGFAWITRKTWSTSRLVRLDTHNVTYRRPLFGPARVPLHDILEVTVEMSGSGTVAITTTDGRTHELFAGDEDMAVSLATRLCDCLPDEPVTGEIPESLSALRARATSAIPREDER
jgi:hypothetical protein